MVSGIRGMCVSLGLYLIFYVSEIIVENCLYCSVFYVLLRFITTLSNRTFCDDLNVLFLYCPVL